MTRGEESLVLFQKRNKEIKSNFYEVLKQEKDIERTFEKLSNVYYLAPITLKHIVYNAGYYRKFKKPNKYQV